MAKDFLKEMFINEAKPALDRYSASGGGQCDCDELNIQNGDGEGSIQTIGDTGTAGSSADTSIYEDANGDLVFNFNSDFNTNAATEYKRVYGEDMPSTFPYGAKGRHSQVLNGKGYAKGKRSRVDGTTSLALEDYSYAGGNTCVSMGGSAGANGIATVAAADGSSTDGFKTIARGLYSHACGEETSTGVDARGAVSAGYKTKANGKYSVSSGYYSTVDGDYSFATNQNTKANAKNSSAFGLSTTADASEQFTIGKYNKENTDALFIVGNGTSKTNKQNAFTVLKDGRAKIQNNPTESDDVANKQYVDDAVVNAAGSGGGSAQLYKHYITIGCGEDDMGFPYICQLNVDTTISNPFTDVVTLLNTILPVHINNSNLRSATIQCTFRGVPASLYADVVISSNEIQNFSFDYYNRDTNKYEKMRFDSEDTMYIESYNVVQC